jgi:RNA polymerase sigma-70 factor, ECF subfamily
LAFHLSDEILARRAAEGKMECFEELLARYRDQVYRICYRMAGNAEDAEDWAQECFVRAYCQLRLYRPSLPFQPWLLKVAVNTCINLSKKRTRQRVLLCVEAPETKGEGEDDPLRLLLATQETQTARQAVDALASPYREAIVLRVLEGLSFREIAQVLGVPLQTAASRVRRALEQVRVHLSPEKPEVPK